MIMKQLKQLICIGKQDITEIKEQQGLTNVFEHCLDPKMCDLVPRDITAELPEPNTQPELYEKITEVQIHSKNHSKTC